MLLCSHEQVFSRIESKKWDYRVDLKSEFENRNHTIWTTQREKTLKQKLTQPQGPWNKRVYHESPRGKLDIVWLKKKKKFLKRKKRWPNTSQFAKRLKFTHSKISMALKEKESIKRIYGQTILLKLLKTRGKEKVMNTSREKIIYCIKRDKNSKDCKGLTRNLDCQKEGEQYF